jgi:alkylation response protein AidB-like acyl-CoA dehydrogenase
MHGTLNPHQKAALLEFREFARTVVAPLASAHDAAERVDRPTIDALAGRGYLASSLPADYGGRAFDMPTYALLHAEIGRACSSLRSLLTVHDMHAQIVLRFGSASQRGNWLPGLAKGQSVAAFALSEHGAGSDTGGIVTRAEERHGMWILEGEKTWVSFGQLADVFIVFARTAEGVSAFRVERDTPGLVVEPIRGMLGLRGSMLADLRFTRCAVPASHLVGPAGGAASYIIPYGLTLGRLSVAAGCVGILDGCLDASNQYARARHQFSVPLLDHQLIKAKLAQMAVDVDAAWLLCMQAAFLIQQGDPRAVIETAIAKHFAASAAADAAREAVQIHGANGCTARYPVERYYRDAKIMEIIEGSNEIQQLIIGEQGYSDLPSFAR